MNTNTKGEHEMTLVKPARGFVARLEAVQTALDRVQPYNDCTNEDTLVILMKLQLEMTRLLHDVDNLVESALTMRRIFDKICFAHEQCEQCRLSTIRKATEG